jgi:predicted transcriptional regulator
MKFRFRGFKTPREIFDRRLGALEREMMEIVWTADEITVRDACVRLSSPVAYTTAMTTLDRLYKKGLLSRRKLGRAFHYKAVATREEVEGAVATELVRALLDRNPDEPLPLLSSLVEAVSDRDRALLDDLERLVREKRRTMDRTKGR